MRPRSNPERTLGSVSTRHGSRCDIEAAYAAGSASAASAGSSTADVAGLKVLMLSDFPRNRSEITGGVDSAAYNLVDALATYTDASVTALAFGHGVSAPETHDLVDGRVRLIRVPQEEHGLNTVSRYYRQRKVVGRIIETERPDLVHAQSEGFYATLAVHSGLPNVYTVHGVGLKE